MPRRFSPLTRWLRLLSGAPVLPLRPLRPATWLRPAPAPAQAPALRQASAAPGAPVLPSPCVTRRAMRTPRPGADINSFHSANNPLSWPQEGGSSRIQRSKSVVTRASRSDRVQRASAWEPGELLCAIVVGGLVCSIMAAFAVAIASRGSSGLVAALTTFVLSCGAGLVLVAVLDTSPGAKIVGVLCGTPCVVAPFVLLVLVATGVLDGSTDFDSAGACPQMLGDGWQQKPLQDLQFGLIRDSNSLWTANIGVKGASDATIASFRHVCPGGVFQLFSRYMQGGKNYELLIGEDTLLATVSSDTRPVGWELTVTDCRGNLVGAVTEPEANSLVISDATGREVGFVKGGSDGFEDDVELVDGVAQQIGVFGTQDGDPDTPVIMAQKAGIRGDTSTAWDLHVVNATHPAAEPLLLASVVAYKIWDGCDGSPWWTNDEDREPACHIRDSVRSALASPS